MTLIAVCSCLSCAQFLSFRFLNRRASIVWFILSGFGQLRVEHLVLIGKNTAVNTERALQRLTQFILGLILKRGAHWKCLSSSFAENFGF